MTSHVFLPQRHEGTKKDDNMLFFLSVPLCLCALVVIGYKS